jgi:hypothetical protein
MRYILMLFTLLLVSPQAHAASMPTPLQGHWCADGLVRDSAGRYEVLAYHLKRGARCPPEDSDDDNSLRITGSKFTWGGSAVQVLSITPRRYEWDITVKHAGDVEDYIFHRDGNKLYVFK